MPCPQTLRTMRDLCLYQHGNRVFLPGGSLFTVYLCELVGVLCRKRPRWYLVDPLMLNPTNTQTLGHVCEEEALVFISMEPPWYGTLPMFKACSLISPISWPARLHTQIRILCGFGETPHLFSFFLHRVPI